MAGQKTNDWVDYSKSRNYLYTFIISSIEVSALY